MEKMMSLEINESMVKPIIEKQIEAAILANIGNPEELISKTVALAMKQKVSSNGNVSQYSYDNKYDYLEILTGNAIREAAKEGLQEWLKDNKQLVKAMVIQEMNKPERHDSLVKAFADAVENSLSCSWSFNCNVNFTKNE
jgi:hypothetical protein